MPSALRHILTTARYLHVRVQRRDERRQIPDWLPLALDIAYLGTMAPFASRLSIKRISETRKLVSLATIGL